MCSPIYLADLVDRMEVPSGATLAVPSQLFSMSAVPPPRVGAGAEWILLSFRRPLLTFSKMSDAAADQRVAVLRGDVLSDSFG